jgi:hypothetical protein
LGRFQRGGESQLKFRLAVKILASSSTILLSAAGGSSSIARYNRRRIMKRRDVLKAIGVLPIASALGACRDEHAESVPPKTGGKVHTLQVLLEGAFAVVLRKDIHRLTAFVPKPDPKSTDLAHYFYFNDPENRKDPAKQEPKGYQFELGEEGLRKYPKADPDTYINPGFNDFVAATEKWRLPESLVTINLPLPRSINFTGRPLKVKFGPNALKPTGLMPTNHILEYGVDDESKIGMKCNDREGQCTKSPFCPPGVMRFYFAIRPKMDGSTERQKHAVDFFNFMLERAFPELRQKYGLVEIEHAEDERQPPYSTRPTDFDHAEPSPALLRTVLSSAGPQPRLLRVASMVDCQSGGFLVNTNTPPTLG